MIVFISCSESAALKRSASPDFNSENSESGMDKINVSYDEYPVSWWIPWNCAFYFVWKGIFFDLSYQFNWFALSDQFW